MINIIDGFYLGKSTPIDSRIVASGSAARNAIAYKYEGLRVYDTSDETPYVWMNNSWQYESQNGVAAVGTTVSYIPLLTSTNVLGNSVVYQSLSGKIGINTTTPAYTLDVNGYIKAGSGFVGDGSNITNINVSSVSGTLPLANLTNGSNNYILVGGTTNPTYTNPSNFTIGYSNNVKIDTESSSSTEHYLIFATGSGGHYAPLKSNSTYLKFYPNTGKLFLNSSGTAASPVLAIGASTTGFYKYGTNGIGISISGITRALFDTTGSQLLKQDVTQLTTFTIPNGSSLYDIYTISAATNYDRVVYFYSNNFDATFPHLLTGHFTLSIYIGTGQVYSKYSASDAELGSSHNYDYATNYTFLLPANKTATFKVATTGILWDTPATFYIKYTKFGLNS